VSNTINRPSGPWQTDVKLRNVTYLIYDFRTYCTRTIAIASRPMFSTTAMYTISVFHILSANSLFIYLFKGKGKRFYMPT